MITDYHAKYIAHDLTRRCASDSVEKLTAVLSDAQVDLNPHQIEAALFGQTQGDGPADTAARTGYDRAFIPKTHSA